jgi:hypothetical protein
MGGSPFLNTGVTFTIFNLSGTLPEEKDKLYRYISGSIITAGDFFIRLGPMLSTLGDFLSS